MRYAKRIRRTIGIVSVAIIASTSAFAAGPASPAVGSALMPSQTAAMTPAVNTAKAGDTASNNLHQIRKRGRRGIVKRGWRRNNGYRFRNHRRLRGRYYGRRHRGGSIAAGIAGLIIGGAIAASRRDYGDRWERCDARYRTFRWSDGTYIPYAGGHRVLCPYLRR